MMRLMGPSHLEQGALAAYPRIERQAVQHLRMHRPELSKIKLLSP